MLARGLDTVIQVAVLLVFGLIDGALSGGSGATVGNIVYFFAIPLVWLGYPAIAEATWRGRTLGKAAFHLRVLTREGAPIRFRHAAIRSIFYLIDGIPFVGVPMLLITRDTVRLGDLVAGTMVVSEGSAASMPTSVYFRVPEGYDDYVRQLDISGLGSGEYELVRQFLLRSASLTGPARWTVAVEVARPVAAKMRHTPPSGMHPELFLQCVAAAFQLRSSALATGGSAWTGAGAQAWAPPGGAPAGGRPGPWAGVVTPGPPPAVPAAPPPPESGGPGSGGSRPGDSFAPPT